jgi:predicted Fe-S protein YdhL (DUF1289 family)
MVKAQTLLPASPCIRQCTLDEHDICLGCFRSLEEILAWQASDAAQRTQILVRCKARRSAHPLRMSAPQG